ncbi:MAG: PEP-CTERM sorting domain-containing protein [Nitrospirae bacterium]|nr:MAG: PEP-CTERM sorting domain-containing protein [Nitrospirota bacterium]
MKRTFPILCFIVCVIVFAGIGESKAVVLTFDDLPWASNATIPSPYGGLYWSNTFHYTYTYYGNGRVSDSGIAFNDWAKDVSVYSTSGTFNWNGAYFTAYSGTKDLNLDLEGWSGGTLIYSTTLYPITDSPSWFNVNWQNIDTLTIHSYRSSGHFYGSHFLMDNFTINEPFQAPVPEPSTILLLGSGLLGIVGLRKRMQTKTS